MISILIELSIRKVGVQRGNGQPGEGNPQNIRAGVQRNTPFSNIEWEISLDYRPFGR